MTSWSVDQTWQSISSPSRPWLFCLLSLLTNLLFFAGMRKRPLHPLEAVSPLSRCSLKSRSNLRDLCLSLHFAWLLWISLSSMIQRCINTRHLQFDTCNGIERFLYCLKEPEFGAIFLGLEADDGYWPLLSCETELGGALPKCKADGNDLCYPGKQECGWTLPKCKVMFLKHNPVTSFRKFVRLLLIKGVDTLCCLVSCFEDDLWSRFQVF